MRPYDAKTMDNVCKLKGDNFETGEFWILTDGYEVSICEQAPGETPKQRLVIPRTSFNKLVAWYMRDQMKI